ncbi:BN159_2729 family protein [Streptomyces sp. Marseille-Q5077]|uniref:BN159_2729 family protein n=1 Tax=Streptomyces sp. Marseille-Q5077 TaxID=3418995 RepID=UPI003D01DED2
MNSNFPHAVGVIRAALESTGADRATAVAHALDTARLLVDPGRSFGVVLHRTSDGGWSPAPRLLTELERKALAWDASCARARSVAHAIERRLAGHAGPSGVHVDGDRVRVVLRVDGPLPWARWRAYLGITVVGAGARPHTVVGEGERGGVRVTVVAHGATSVSPSVAPASAAGPSSVASPSAAALSAAPPSEAPPPAAPASSAPGPHTRLFRFGGLTYDLAFPQRDAQGDVWYFQGCRSHDGMPLMSLDGRPERCSLANVAIHLGPLSPVRSGSGDAGRALPPPAPSPAVPSGSVCGPIGPVV